MTAIKRLIPNLFTAGNLIGGILAIICTLTGHIQIAPFFIFISAVLDFFDGFMARLLKVPSELGKQLDSLADMVTFGVAPGIIVFTLMGGLDIFAPEGRGITNVYNLHGISYLPFLALLIPVFALFRLAKFNLDTRQSFGFIGLPTPAMTLFFAPLPLLILNTVNGVLLGEIPQSSMRVTLAETLSNPFVLIVLTLIFSILMVVELPLFALKFKNFAWKGNEIRYIFLLISILLILTLFLWALPLIVILYLVLSLINLITANKEA